MNKIIKLATMGQKGISIKTETHEPGNVEVTDLKCDSDPSDGFKCISIKRERPVTSHVKDAGEVLKVKTETPSEINIPQKKRRRSPVGVFPNATQSVKEETGIRETTTPAPFSTSTYSFKVTSANEAITLAPNACLPTSSKVPNSVASTILSENIKIETSAYTDQLQILPDISIKTETHLSGNEPENVEVIDLKDDSDPSDGFECISIKRERPATSHVKDAGKVQKVKTKIPSEVNIPQKKRRRLPEGDFLNATQSVKEETVVSEITTPASFPTSISYCIVTSANDAITLAPNARLPTSSKVSESIASTILSESIKTKTSAYTDQLQILPKALNFNTNRFRDVTLTQTSNSTSESRPVPSWRRSSIPDQLKYEVGQRMVRNGQLRHIVLDWDIVEMSKLYRGHKLPQLAAEFKKVKDTYGTYQEYYNIYLPLMLAQFWSDLFKSYEHLRPPLIVSSGPIYRRQNIWYLVNRVEVSDDICTYHIHCEAIVRSSDVTNNLVPKHMEVVLVTSSSGHEFLGLVRKYRQKNFFRPKDDPHASIPFNFEFGEDGMTKMKINIIIELACSPLKTGRVFQCSKLKTMNGLFKMNGALLRLEQSNLKSVVLNPADVPKITLPTTNNYSQMTEIAKCISRKNNITLVTIHPDNHLNALGQVVSRLRLKSAKLLVSCNKDMFHQAARMIISLGYDTMVLTRERKMDSPELRTYSPLKDEFHSHSLDENAKRSSLTSVLRQCEVLVVQTENCYFDDIIHTNTKFDVCVLVEASTLTEAESILPLTYYCRHVLLMGSIDKSAQISSLTSELGYEKSFFHRACATSRIDFHFGEFKFSP